MEYTKHLSQGMQDTLAQAGYHTPTPIQAQSLEPLMNNRDLLGIAQTGTGKTAAFAVPIIERIFLNNRKVQALILCPTRELALQITAVFKLLSEHLKPLRVVSVYGGQAPMVQIKALRAGAHVVVGTPGRVKDMIGRNVLKLQNVRTVVLDEADEMLNFGFLPDITHILNLVEGEHQTMLFSATMNKEIGSVAQRFLKDPLSVEVGERNEPVKLVSQSFAIVNEKDKPAVVQRLIASIDPRLTLIFANTRRKVKLLETVLAAQGLTPAALHGDLKQKERDKIMAQFRSGEARILVATDVAARGIDVSDIDLVINYDVPEKREYYVHRIGRTGRAGQSGRAVTLVCQREKTAMLDIQRHYHIDMMPEMGMENIASKHSGADSDAFERRKQAERAAQTPRPAAPRTNNRDGFERRTAGRNKPQAAPAMASVSVSASAPAEEGFERHTPTPRPQAAPRAQAPREGERSRSPYRPRTNEGGGGSGFASRWNGSRITTQDQDEAANAARPRQGGAPRPRRAAGPRAAAPAKPSGDRPAAPTKSGDAQNRTYAKKRRPSTGGPGPRNNNPR